MPLAPESGVATSRKRTSYSSSSRLALGHERRTSLTKLFTGKGYKTLPEHTGTQNPEIKFIDSLPRDRGKASVVGNVSVQYAQVY